MKSTALLFLLLSSHLFASPPAWLEKAGGSFAFRTLEAEAQQTTGKTIVQSGKPGPIVTPEMEASGRGYIELTATGQSVNFPAATDANAFVLRHCIPDSENGGGTEATLSLFINGKFRQSIPLSSRHNWLYGEAGQNGQSNTPGATPHVFWEESRYFIQDGVKSGDRIELRKTESDTAAFYRIDLIEFEQVSAPIAQPPSSLNVVDFGANGSDDKDDSAAIIACIAAAKEHKKSVWIPAGTFYQSKRFDLDGAIVVRGAGLWHTQILGTSLGQDFAGNMGFRLTGDGPQVSDLYLECIAQTQRGKSNGKGFTGNAKNWSVENVWITHTQTAFWMSAASHGSVRNCRVRFTYADGINLNRGTSDTIVENNHVRGTGDDGLAILSETERKDPPAKNNVLRNNTVTAVWWGHNCDLAGGSNHLIEHNVLADNAMMGVFTINMTSAFPNHPLTDSIIRRNALIRGGGNYVKQKRGAAWILADSTTVTDVTFEENYIESPMYSGIQLIGKSAQKILFKNNLITNPGENGIVIKANAIGSGEFLNNTINGVPKEGQAILNSAPPNAYQATIK